MTCMAAADGIPAPPVRVAILSDTHGQLDPRILDLIGGCDLAMHGGDIGGVAILDALAARVPRVLAVTGNNDLPDKWPPCDSKRLRALPEVIELPLPGGDLVAIHGHQTQAKGRHEHLRRRFPHARAVVYGHSHRLILDREQTPWVLNPGAAGRSRTYGGPSCLVLIAGRDQWRLEQFRFPLHGAEGRCRPASRDAHQHTVK